MWWSRLLLGGICVGLLTGFQLFVLHWSSPAVLVVRCVSANMPEGLCDRAPDAAGMWRSDSLQIRIVNEQYAGPVQGEIVRGSTHGQGHMGTELYADAAGHHLAGCTIFVDHLEDADGPVYTGTDATPAGQFDAMTELAHELGHCIGLQHEDNATPPALMRTLIHRGQYQRTLSPDDRAGRDRLFPPVRSGMWGCGKKL